MSWLRWRREQRECFHHDRSTGESFIRDRIIDGGRKMFTCARCFRNWL